MLAVSGGLDSMVLLDVAAGVGRRRDCQIHVATFDHGSGAHSTRAAAAVARAALAHGLPPVVGCGGEIAHTEAAWRTARWEFLTSVSNRLDAPVITAHTRDDQIETVLMRAMRAAGARGLAGLRTVSEVRRPFLDVSRAELRAFAHARGLRWVEDPSNRSMHFLRNRIRRDLLPALLRSRPILADELLDIAERAAEWRRALAECVDANVHVTISGEADDVRGLDVPVADLDGLDLSHLGILWPELASRANVTLDRRGTTRAAAFSLAARVGSRVQLSGGWELSRSRDALELRAAGPPATDEELAPPMTWDLWRFGSSEEPPGSDPWRFAISLGVPLQIRAWEPGDRLAIRHGGRMIRRKVKYFLSDSRISGHIRARWPVVVAGDEIAWIPGVRRSDAAAVRSGGPVVTYVCDYLDRRP